MSNEMDVQRLIAEVKKRPTLWDVRFAEYKDRTNTPQLWQEIADIIGVDVEHCKRKWKNLRDAYRAEVRRTERRMERLKSVGEYDKKLNTASKWVYFEPMSFINESKRPRHSVAQPSTSVALAGEGSSGSPDNAVYDPLQNFCDIKMEPHHTTDEDEDDDVNDLLFEEFKSVATPQAARRLSNSISIGNAVEEEAHMASSGKELTATSCACVKRADDQVNFLENLEREELKLMKSTRQEISRVNSVGHIGDSDYNFLVSFLPQMKKMSELQNLQFRAKLSELLLVIMAPNASIPSTTISAITVAPTSLCYSIPPAITQVPAQLTPSQSFMSTATVSAPIQYPTAEQSQHLQHVLQTDLMDADQNDSANDSGLVTTSSSSGS